MGNWLIFHTRLLLPGDLFDDQAIDDRLRTGLKHRKIIGIGVLRPNGQDKNFIIVLDPDIPQFISGFAGINSVRFL